MFPIFSYSRLPTNASFPTYIFSYSQDHKIFSTENSVFLFEGEKQNQRMQNRRM